MNKRFGLQTVMCMFLLVALSFLHGTAIADDPPLVEGVNIISSNVTLLTPTVEDGQEIEIEVTATTFGAAPNWRTTYVWISYTGNPNSWDVSECVDHTDYVGAGTYSETFNFAAPVVGTYPLLARVAGSSFSNCLSLPPGFAERAFILDVVEQRPEISIPTFSKWGIIIFILLAGLGSFFYLRKQSYL